MADKTIVIYCFFDDLFKVIGPKTDPHCKLNDAEIATVAIMAAISFYGNQAAACDYMQRHYGMKMIDKSGFNRRLRRLQTKLISVFRALGASLKDLNTSARYVIDSFPVAVCRNCRIRVCKSLKGKGYHGYNEAKKEYFYGFKVQLIVTADNQPIDYFITAGSFHDSTALQAMQVDLPAGSQLYGDSGYTDYEQEDLVTGMPKGTSIITDKYRTIFWLLYTKEAMLIEQTISVTRVIMKTYLLSLCLLLAGQAMAQQEKKFWIGPKAGLHLTQLVGQSVGTSKVNTHASAGLSAEYRLNPLLALSADVVYSRLGGSYGSADTSAAFKDYKLVMQFDYIHLPLVLRVSPGRSPFFLEAGGQLGFYLSRRVTINDLNGQTQPNQSMDAGLIAGIGQHITKHLCVNFRYYRGLTSIWKPSYYTNPLTGQTSQIPVAKQVHQSFGLQATYYF